MRSHVFNALIIISCIAALGCSHIDAIRRGGSQSDPTDVDRVLSIARLTERRGEASQAREMYEGLVAGGNALAKANHRLGVMAAKDRDFDRAWKHFDAAQANGLESSELFADIGYARLLSGDFEAAEEQFGEALKRTPSDKRSLNNMAILRGAQGRFSESLAFSRRAVGPAKAQANLGYLLSQFGDAEKAVQHYHLALNQDPSLKVAASALLQIEQAKSTDLTMPKEVIAEKPAKPSPVSKATAAVKAKRSNTVSKAKPESIAADADSVETAEVVVPEIELVAESADEKEELPLVEDVTVGVSVVEEESPSRQQVEGFVEEEVIVVHVEEPANSVVDAFVEKVASAKSGKSTFRSTSKMKAEKLPVSVELGADSISAQTYSTRLVAAEVPAAAPEKLVAAVAATRLPSPRESSLPRMSSRRQWSRSSYHGEARTISYHAEAVDPRFGFSVLHLPEVESVE